MPNLTLSELESWIDDFVLAEPHRRQAVWAVDHSWDQTAIDTALVYVRLDISHSDGYLRREIGGDAEWRVTFLARPQEFTTSADETMSLADEVAGVGRLCGYLTSRTAQHLARYRQG